MKKFLSILFAFIICIHYSPLSSFANSKTTLTTYTLPEIRKLALKNAETLQTFQSLYEKYEKERNDEEAELGEKYTTYNENGEEITKYLSGRSLSYNYSEKLDSFEKRIKSIKKQNELRAIRKYNEILSKEIEITKKKNALGLAQTDLVIAQAKVSTGQGLPMNIDLSKSNVETLRSDLKNLNIQLDGLYEDLNRLTGLPKKSRYKLDSDQLLTLANINKMSLSIPVDSLDYVYKDSDQIKDLEKRLREKKKAFEIFLKTKSYDPETYRAKEEELDIEGLQKTLDKNKNALYFDLENDYLDILISAIHLSDFKNNLDFSTYQNHINKTKYQNGLLSKRAYIEEENILLDLKNEYISEMLLTYQKILLYQIKIGADS